MKNKLGIGITVGFLLFSGHSYAQADIDKQAGVHNTNANIRICVPTSSRTHTPLYIVKSGKKSIALTDTHFRQLDPKQITSINVYKPSEVPASYGEKAKWGVIEVEVPAKTFREIKKASKNGSIQK
ncbi:hypothetical protein GCM10023231_30540 [Olivibacter ginsenosidimutans]|uniref:Uncharacterized protein n=1 Tax=Olivibacter ginsenosidimutans TaxID=1176537 RepID=A0ABP9BWG5_9SPHI